MRRNVEFKARVHDPAAARTIADQLAGASHRQESQTDTYFHVQSGRLKLRETTNPDRAELIGYARPDTKTQKLSSYRLLPIEDATTAKAMLTDALGVCCVVQKTRLIWLVEATRIHLDQVAGLGDFLEIEVVLGDTQTEAQGREIAESFRTAFTIEAVDMIAESYSDMLVDR